VPLKELKPQHDSKSVTVGGAINDVREITTKNGKKMAFVKLEDQTAELELILFPNAYQQTTGLWERDKVILARGKISAKDREGNIGEEIKIMVDDAREITAEQATNYQATGKKLRTPGAKKSAAAAAVTATRTAASVKPLPERIYIRLLDSENQALLLSLKQAIDGAVGTTEVVLVLGPADSKQIIKLPAGIAKDETILGTLQSLVGAENIKIQ
jgi:DNA polymerase III alpha subunit